MDAATRLGRGGPSTVLLPFTSNTDFGGGPQDRAFRTELNINPALVIPLTPNWNVISNTQLMLRHLERVYDTSKTGLGDTIQNTWLSPAPPPKERGFTWGVGAVFLAPTATPPALGQREWGIGPSGFAAWKAGPFTAGLVVNQTWAFAGQRRGRPDVNRTYLYPFVSYALPSKTTLNLTADITYDWQGRQSYVPVTASVSRPVTLAGQLVILGAGVRAFAGDQKELQNVGVQVNVTFVTSRE